MLVLFSDTHNSSFASVALLISCPSFTDLCTTITSTHVLRETFIDLLHLNLHKICISHFSIHLEVCKSFDRFNIQRSLKFFLLSHSFPLPLSLSLSLTLPLSTFFPCLVSLAFLFLFFCSFL